MNRALVLVVAIAAASVGGCGSSPEQANAPVPRGPIHVIVESGATSASVDARVGQQIDVSLPGELGTGYAWEMENLDGLTPMGSSVQQGGQTEAFGSSGRWVLSISCQQPGSYPVKFLYRRPWEGAGAARVYTLNVNAVP